MTAASGPSRALLLGLAALLAAIGLASRVAPLADQEGRLLRQFPTEDGYLMLTIARNQALGNGMSIADGTIPTNGTQPLATFLWAGAFRSNDGDKRKGVATVLLLELAIALLGALVLQRLGLRAFAQTADPGALAVLAAAVWWASPMSVRHSMNCLETGVYALAVLLVLLILVRGPGARRVGPAWSAWASLGALLGITFWARNDAVLLCAAVGLAHLANALPGWRGPLGRRVVELAGAATVTFLVASPWLVHNWISFGHVVPVSGQAESLGASFGQNWQAVPVKLFEYVMMFLPVPSGIEERTPVVVGSMIAVLIAAAAVVTMARRWTETQRLLLVVGGIYGLALSAFYGLSFGAGHFMSRYLFPCSLFLALLWVGAFVAGWRWLAPRVPRVALLVGALTVAGLALALNVRLYVLGKHHMHFQVAEWVEQNVPDEAWVGAIQTGTVGFFHDRTINLDGKVNPEALAARREQALLPYVVDREIQYLADWVGIASWAERAELAPYFELVVEDSRSNLAVLRRRAAPLLPLPATAR